MPRLAPLLIKGADAGDVCVDFHFNDDGEGHPVLTGRLTATLPVSCQRCLQAMTVRIDAPVRLRMVRDEGETPPDVDVLLVTTEAMSLAHIAEEELLLSMPMTARHPQADCPVKLPRGQGPAGEHPFAALAALKREGRTKHSDVK
ncbi:MAG TPA: DUF177 domain-containing protein [Gammaproteobacteria bacterium]|nr:DUF177 domain-containing protein [Gammaproteobacteria bacterium]